MTQTTTKGFPPFSWDTVPLYIHFGKSEAPLTDEEVAFVAERSDFVCLEKGQGVGVLGSTEKGTAHDAARLKKANPGMKVLFYWNHFLNYRMYDACRTVAEHPDYILRDSNGDPIFKSGSLEQYNLLNADFRRWWAEVAGKGVKEYNCDGIFMDALEQPRLAEWMERGWGVGNEHLLVEAQQDMMKRAFREMGEEAILLYNGIRSSDEDRDFVCHDFLDESSGATIEHFGAFWSRTPGAMARDLEAMDRAGKKGKIVAFKGWPGPDFNWINSEKMALPHDQLVREAREKIGFSLACFLVAAQEQSYFCYSWGYRDQHGSLVDYPELSRPLGAPTGDADRQGYLYTREFAHASVRVDLEASEAQIDWTRS